MQRRKLINVVDLCEVDLYASPVSIDSSESEYTPRKGRKPVHDQI